MWEETRRLLWIWCRITLGLTLVCAVVLTVYGGDSTPFKVAALVAVVLELAVIRGLAREWSWLASSCWWWPR